MSEARVGRRAFLCGLGAACAVVGLGARRAFAAPPKAKITRIRVYAPQKLNPIFNQSNMIVTIETDAGITGVGEGGSKDTLEQCAGRLIGRNPYDIERCWQEMYRAFFYPPGREKIHALGALDLALWDIKGKALDVPVYELLGGMNRNYLECYATGALPPAKEPDAPPAMSLKERAAATIASGFRAFRMDAASVKAGAGNVYDTRERVHKLVEDCKEVREGVGKDGNWLIDFHTRFDYADAVRACKLIEDLEPLYVEDPVRVEAFLEDIPKLRKMTTCPLAAGEQWGQRWDFNKLVEAHDIDWLRATVPNVGGISEMHKVLALCETHAVGIAPHFTGPVATAALVHVLGPYSGPVLCEFVPTQAAHPHLPEWADFKEGKLHPNKRPGLGVTLDMKALTQVAEIAEAGTGRKTYFRTDGSQTNW
ncbi:MAG TPA: mandelate racemase/muconate lactonizing enzyme family protein [Planctomycetota bacterium]|nr:mandelate racemase/muconate lactonizing enzyme family protein [Planctomycetota bacterium]